MALEIKLTLNPDDNMTSHADLLRRVAVALERGKELAAVVEGAAVPPAVAVKAGEAAAAAKAKPAPKAAAPAASEPVPVKRGPGRPPKVKPAPPPAHDEDETDVEVEDEEEVTESSEPTFEPRRNERAAVKAGKGKAAAPKAEEADDEEDEADDDDMGIDLDDSDADPAHKAKLTLEGDLLPALRAYGNSFSDKAEATKKLSALIKSFGVNNARDIPEDKYEAVLKKIGKLK